MPLCTPRKVPLDPVGRYSAIASRRMHPAVPVRRSLFIGAAIALVHTPGRTCRRISQ